MRSPCPYCPSVDGQHVGECPRDPRHRERRELDTDRVEFDDGDVGELVDSTVTVHVREGLCDG